MNDMAKGAGNAWFLVTISNYCKRFM